MTLPKNYKDIFILFLVGTSGGQEKVKSQGLMRDDFMDFNPVGVFYGRHKKSRRLPASYVIRIAILNERILNECSYRSGRSLRGSYY